MKISNSKKQLAKIIHENGGWCDVAEWSALEQQGGDVWLCALKPLWNAGIGIFSFKDHVKTIPGSYKLPNIHQTILSREEYFHLYPAPDADGWIEWSGGECPVGEDVVVEIKTRDGEIQLYQAYGWNWSHERGSPVKDRQIIAYRINKPEQAKPEFCEAVMRSIPEPSDKPTIEQLAADYRNAKDYAERKQQEADAAKAEAEAKLAELGAAGKAIGLVLSVAAPEPELVITDWRDLKVGDEIECIGGTWDSRFTGRAAFVSRLEAPDYNGCLPILVEVDGEGDWGDNFKFIRRPAKGDTNAWPLRNRRDL